MDNILQLRLVFEQLVLLSFEDAERVYYHYIVPKLTSLAEEVNTSDSSLEKNILRHLEILRSGITRCYVGIEISTEDTDTVAWGFQNTTTDSEFLYTDITASWVHDIDDSSHPDVSVTNHSTDIQGVMPHHHGAHFLNQTEEESSEPWTSFQDDPM